MTLKQISPRSIALLVAFMFGLAAEWAGAATVSINIADGTHPVGDGAGFVPANHWNNLNYGGSDTTFDGLVDETGAAQSVTLRIQGNDRRTGAVGGGVDVNTDLFFRHGPGCGDR